MNIASLVLGAVSLIFAVHAFQVKGCLICCTVSLGTCGGALLCQLAELYRLAQIGDMAAICDTAYARVLAGVALLTLTLGLQVAALLRSSKKKCETC